MNNRPYITAILIDVYMQTLAHSKGFHVNSIEDIFRDYEVNDKSIKSALRLSEILKDRLAITICEELLSMNRYDRYSAIFLPIRTLENLP